MAQASQRPREDMRRSPYWAAVRRPHLFQLCAIAAIPSCARRTVRAVAPPEIRLDVAPYDYAAARRLAAELGVSHVVAQVLVRRGFAAPEAARAFLDAGVRHPLDAFGGLREGAARILDHAGRGARITVHGDYDVDGVSATAVLVRALRTVGADVDWYLPSRIDDGYGLALGTVERLAARGTELLVTVDCAITAVDEVAAARAAGLDVVVTDHHAPRADGRLPDAPIVHPGVGGYPCPELCATGWRTCSRGRCSRRPARTPPPPRPIWTWSRSPRWPTACRSWARTGGSCASGLRALGSTRKPGLQALMDVARVDPSGVDAGRDRLPARAADQRGRAPAPRRRRAGAAADGRRAARPGDRRRARRGEHGAPRRRDADPVRGRGAGGGDAAGRGGVRARRRRLASRA